ncbi:lipid-binding SYLF domain-containing protein [Roseococcus sp. YIM B11640]|uniref:lipid-binding SYLF domain-containing protein n=1 Tax=Roseococcus sp. YIM B11640 TaxID=3133973 RepID=UPI003C79EBD1
MPSRHWTVAVLGLSLLSGCAQNGLLPDSATMPATAVAEGTASVTPLISAAATSIEPFLNRPEWEGFRNISGGAQAILIIPSATRVGLIVGVQEGEGILMQRHGSNWSDPVFVKLGNYNVGFLGGASSSTVAMFLLTRSAIAQFIDGSERISAAGGLALGDWGAGSIGAGGIAGGAQAITAETSRGLFAGGGLGAARLTLDMPKNRTAYGPGFQATRVLSAPGGAIASARGLRQSLTRAVQHAQGGG